MALGGTLGTLDRFPVRVHVVGAVDLHLREHVRVAALHLVADRTGHVGKAERTLLTGHLRMEHNLQQQIAQLVLQVDQITAVDRVGYFVGFLDGVRRDAGKILLQVPGAAALRVAQPRHDAQQAVQFSGGGHAVLLRQRVRPAATRATAGGCRRGR